MSHAGYPVLRLLAEGTRSRVWLLGDGRVLKVLTPQSAPGAVVAEAEALHRARGDHVVPLLDASAVDGELGLVFPRLDRGSLAGLLTARETVDAGEAVTILVPVATALARMHGAGVAHGSLDPAAILFSAEGAPVLTGFGSAESFEAGLPEVRRERLAPVVADRDALQAVARALLMRIAGPRAAAARAIADRLRDGDAVDVEQVLIRELSELAAARPVVFEAPVGDSAPRVPGRTVSVAEQVTAEGPDAGTATAAAGRFAALAGVVLESGPGRVAREAARRGWSVLSPSRRRAVLAAAAGIGALLVLIAVVPGPSTPSPPTAPVADSAVVDEEAGAEQAGTEQDPLAALASLLEVREGCLRAMSVLCLAGVAQDGSAAAVQDRAWLQGMIDAGATPPPISADGAVVVERLGDSVLVALSPGNDPASVLLMRTEAGWRIRDYLMASPGG